MLKFDIASNVLTMLVLSHTMLTTIVGTLLTMGLPIDFSHGRPAVRGTLFTINKFRTMWDARDVRGQLLPDSERPTAFGRFQRSSSLDELPELWRVLKEGMSLVGPQPLLMENLPLYYV